MAKIKNIIRKARRIPKPENKPIAPADHYAIARMYQERWGESVGNVRDRNFKKALHARQVQLDAINAEKARQADILKQRMKNLKKARKVLAKQRSNDELHPK